MGGQLSPQANPGATLLNPLGTLLEPPWVKYLKSGAWGLTGARRGPILPSGEPQGYFVEPSLHLV